MTENSLETDAVLVLYYTGDRITTVTVHDPLDYPAFWQDNYVSSPLMDVNGEMSFSELTDMIASVLEGWVDSTDMFNSFGYSYRVLSNDLDKATKYIQSLKLPLPIMASDMYAVDDPTLTFEAAVAKKIEGWKAWHERNKEGDDNAAEV